MTIYQFSNGVVSKDDPGFEAVLAKAYGNHQERPLCLCKSAGIPMYIAKVGQQYIIKRMPNTAEQHHVSCDSYEAPAELSGLGQVTGTAIQENTEDGTTALKFGFSLSKSPGRQMPKGSGQATDTVKTDGTKLTLRSTLHYLWEQASLNKYYPAMQGKRSWYIIRKHLLQAAADKLAKGQNLSSLIYIPETFFLDKKEEIDSRRMAVFNQIKAAEKGTRKLMIVAAEVKQFDQSRYGYKVVFKHLPGCHFMINEDLYKRITKRFATELELWNALENSHLMLIGTFGVSHAGIPSLEEASLVNVSDNWIPFENSYEYALLQALTEQGRGFIKGLRYNMAPDKAMAAAVLHDTGEAPVALYIVDPNNEKLVEQTDELIEQSSFRSWAWHTDNSMPAFPEVQKV